MPANWQHLTQFLNGRSEVVHMDWQEFDEIVGGVPASAIDHYPQWWHGDRPQTRAWRAAGYEAEQIRPGRSVVFRRAADASRARTGVSRSVDRLDHSVETDAVLGGLDRSRVLLIVPCSARKRPGGTAAARLLPWPRELVAAQRPVLADAGLDDSRLMPAWQRYDGEFYRAAGAGLRQVAEAGRLIILSGGYGLIDGAELIGTYDRVLSLADWPPGLLEDLLQQRARASNSDVVAFAAATTAYATLLRRIRWDLPAGRRVFLVSVSGLRGAANVSRRLGEACNSFLLGEHPRWPEGIRVEPLTA
ncbi:hypothetical protein EV646_112187 [Kribbella antiqua]|uniref:DUF7662 domain-containing protein n=1 Tax=Kribbella antiqua TaxID=2512217 RepID=A0A4V2S3C8_9ACTN|nr:hypothetical protein [Kribbella antiqua]TCO43610.1 hypothetical protein EV646_112187 [Kribbella antiqua]